ncbi:MAG: hypothetical protein ACFUZC_12045 [Chthoniobacteraceae bacterium]
MRPRLHKALALLLPLLLAGIGRAAPAREYPLGNARFAVTVRAPLEDWVKTEGPRFDISAAVVSARLDGEEYLTAQGLADEFNPKWIAPPGYNEARPGEPFLKIGIGNLIRLDRFRYLFGKFPVQRLAPNRLLRASAEEASFSQVFNSGIGYAYTYEKTYRVDPTRATLRIHYKLRNTGAKPLLTEQYNHNWVWLGPAPYGGYVVRSPFALQPTPDLPFDGLEIRKGHITLTRPVTQPSHATTLQYVRAWRNRLRLSNPATGRWVEISGNFPVSRFSLFANAESVCPEVFCQWALAPGKTAEWERTYRFGY